MPQARLVANRLPPHLADPSAVLDFDIRAATVPEAVVEIADRAGYKVDDTDELWSVRWTGSYRAKATTYDALADVLYGSNLCPAIRDDVITIRACYRSHPVQHRTVPLPWRRRELNY